MNLLTEYVEELSVKAEKRKKEKKSKKNRMVKRANSGEFSRVLTPGCYPLSGLPHIVTRHVLDTDCSLASEGQIKQPPRPRLTQHGRVMAGSWLDHACVQEPKLDDDP